MEFDSNQFFSDLSQYKAQNPGSDQFLIATEFSRTAETDAIIINCETGSFYVRWDLIEDLYKDHPTQEKFRASGLILENEGEQPRTYVQIKIVDTEFE